VILSIAILFSCRGDRCAGAGWRNARDDSKEHIFRIFCAFALGFIPTLLLDEVDEALLAPISRMASGISGHQCCPAVAKLV